MKPLTDIIILGSKPNKGMKSQGALSNINIIGSQSILDNQIKNLQKKININNIIYVGGYGFSELKNDKKISYIDNVEYESKNNAYSLGLALNKITTNNVLIFFNKIIFSHEIFNYFDFHESQIFISKYSSYKIGSIINKNTSKIENLFFNLDNRCCGIYYISGKELDYIKLIYESYFHIDNLFIFEIINKSIDMGGIYKPKFINKKRLLYEIKNNNTLDQFRKYYAKNFNI